MTAVLPTYLVRDVDDDLTTLLSLHRHAEAGHAHLVQLPITTTCAEAGLPDRATDVRTVQLDKRTFAVAVADVDDALVLLETWSKGGRVTCSAGDTATARAIAEELRGPVPDRQPGGPVDVTFSDMKSSRYVELQTRPWTSVRGNYPDPVRDALDGLVGHAPDVDAASRLLRWHGAPGGGKTTAIRALLDAWRGWADGIVVTDPEALLADGRYLRRTVLDNDDSDRWQLLVLEDAETLLHKGGAGRGMATLLNLCDGLLGQGLRCLFLITTNEPLDSVHPALVRPGRCLSRVEFGPLPASHAARLLSRPVSRPMTLAEVYGTAPVSVEAVPLAIGQYL